jgi:hypothetical protein
MQGEDFTKTETELGEGWDESERILSERSKSAFLKIEDGKSVLVNCVGNPRVYEKSGFNPGDPPSTRVKVDVFVIGENCLMTWDMSKTTFDQLKRQRARRGTGFDDSVIEVGRQGVEKKTKYWLEYVRQLEAKEVEQRASHFKGGNSSTPF